MLVSVVDLRKHYRAAWSRESVDALRGVSFGIPEGSTVGLLGRNGAGNPTTLRLLLGLDRSDGGEIRWAGERKPPLAWLPETEVFDPALPPAAYLPLFADPSDRSSLTPMAERLHVTRLLRRRAGTLSAGERRRCALALALVASASLVLLDEPVVGVDPVELEAVKDAVRQRQADGATIVVSTHLLRELDDLIEHVVLLDRGRVLATGPRTELCQRIRVRVLEADPSESLRAREGPGTLCLAGRRLILPADDRGDRLGAELAGVGVGTRASRPTIHDLFMWEALNAEHPDTT